MIKQLRDFILLYKFELILTICMFSNLYPVQLPGYLYYISVFGIAYGIRKYHASSSSRTGLTLSLVAVVILSSFLAGTLDSRTWGMCFLLLIALAYSSEGFYRFKFTFMYISLMGYAFTSLINFYAKQTGVNLYDAVLISTWGASTGEFSGYTCHPMWLSAACGIGTIFFVYAMIVMFKRRSKLATVLLGVGALISIWTTMQGGSRSASGISVLCCLFLILNAFESASQKRQFLIPIILVALMTLPSMVLDNAQFNRKQGGLNLVDEGGQSSRTALWTARIAEFKSSPILGVGFGVIKEGPEEFIRNQSTETGSGWLTALAQTGIIGFGLVFLLFYRAKLPRDYMRTDSTAALLEAVLLFLGLHSLFEAYMFQVGWYMCFVFWLLVGILDDYKTYGPVPELEGTLFGAEEEEEENESEDESEDENE